MKNNYYYDLKEDITEFPKDWAYIIIGGRNTGKTYSSLMYAMKNKIKFVFIKRTIEDIDLLCAGSGQIGSKQNEYGIDLSPFKSINRDAGTNIRAFSIKKGLGGFWECDEDGTPSGSPIGYLIALSAVQKFKGFDLSDCELIIFDEFIPQPWERINKKEGEQMLDLYKTVSRDREHRGREALKLICLANAVSISNPVCNTLEITDIIAEMQIRDEEYFHIEERGILIHLIHDNAEFLDKEKNSLIYKAMSNTAWGRMAFDNSFAYNDFSSISKTYLKGYRCQLHVHYKENDYYIYMKDGVYYMCRSLGFPLLGDYDLNLENDQKAFYTDWAIDLRNKCISGKMKFQTYTMYDLIVNYKKFFIV